MTAKGKEGGKLRAYLKDNNFNQEELADSMGMTRQGLHYHFTKDVLDYEFKMELRKHGVKLFDENGRLTTGDDSDDSDLDLAALAPFVRRWIGELKENKKLQSEVIALQKERIAELEAEIIALKSGGNGSRGGSR